MRTVVIGNFDQSMLVKDLKLILDKNSFINIINDNKKDIVLFVTKEEHVIGDLLIRYISGALDVNIKAVISNHNILKKLVDKFNIPFHHISCNNLTKQQHEETIIECLDLYEPYLIVLAKYMRIFSVDFVNKYTNKILNIHHSFLPSFIGSNPYKQAYDKGVKIIGATAHIVTSNLDEGPIIYQDIIRIDHTYSLEKMKEYGKNVEKIVLSNALHLLIENRVFINDNKTIIL